MSSFVSFTPLDKNGAPAQDRELDEIELEAEQKAEKFSLKNFKRINPIPGRIGFLLRNLHKDVGVRNEMVMSFIELVDGANKRKFIRVLRNWWNLLDDYSRKRVDIFDLFCEKYDIHRSRLWAVIQEGMYVNNDALTKTALDGIKPKLIPLLWKMAEKERNVQDRKILSEAVGIIGGEAPVIQDNSQTTNNTLVVNDNNGVIPSFADSIRRSDKNVRKTPTIEKKPQPRELTEGEQNYIVDGYIVETEEEREAVLAKRNSLEEVETELLTFREE